MFNFNVVIQPKGCSDNKRADHEPVVVGEFLLLKYLGQDPSEGRHY